MFHDKLIVNDGKTYLPTYIERQIITWRHRSFWLISADKPEQMRVLAVSVGAEISEKRSDGNRSGWMEKMDEISRVRRKSSRKPTLYIRRLRTGKRISIVHSLRSELRRIDFSYSRLFLSKARKRGGERKRRRTTRSGYHDRQKEHAYVPALHKGPGVTPMHCATVLQSIARATGLSREQFLALSTLRKEEKKNSGTKLFRRPHDSRATTSR